MYVILYVGLWRGICLGLGLVWCVVFCLVGNIWLEFVKIRRVKVVGD